MGNGYALVKDKWYNVTFDKLLVSIKQINGTDCSSIVVFYQLLYITMNITGFLE